MNEWNLVTWTGAFVFPTVLATVETGLLASTGAFSAVAFPVSDTVAGVLLYSSTGAVVFTDVSSVLFNELP